MVLGWAGAILFVAVIVFTAGAAAPIIAGVAIALSVASTRELGPREAFSNMWDRR
ncbi:hypothetical protein H4V99_003349 [Cryobacterium sp. CG_9.6]|nr:hypothetical protein [Cryobacterium sp. CG_9.6]